ncbi:MAG: cytochrome C oxidase subunit IV family protein [Verrucomicrobia bacterium]|nr:cytochrome C oxidase subunit IV family protein [Verrucomicrobiota bacterium]
MSEHTDDISKHVRGYMIVGGTLLIGTILTVLASYVDLGHEWNIVLALIIATAKASLVALFFMHLISERQMIYVVLAFTAFFLVGLMFLTIGAYADFPPLTTTR